jgi:D-alanine-D-alanine ligase
MRVGLTYDLREDYLSAGYSEEQTAEFDCIDTIEAIEGALRELGYATERIGNVKALAQRLVSGTRWDLVFNLAEGLRGYGREAQVPALLEAYAIAYTFSDPLVLTVCLHKGMTKHVIRDLGLPTPDFAVIEDAADLARVDLPLPLFAKPVAEGTGKGVSDRSKIETRAQMYAVCLSLLEKFQQPVLLETFLPGRELTVGVLGNGKRARAIGVLEVVLGPRAEGAGYSYLNKKNYEELVEYRLATDSTAQRAREVALASWQGLGCRDAGRVDLRVDACGIPNFLEVNPLAGLHPVHSDLPIVARMAGISFRELIAAIMLETLARVDQRFSTSMPGDAIKSAGAPAGHRSV